MPIHALQPARLPLAAALALCLLPATRVLAQDSATTLDSIQVSGSWLGTGCSSGSTAATWWYCAWRASICAGVALAARSTRHW